MPATQKSKLVRATLGRATRAIHAGQMPNALTGAVMTKIDQNSACKSEELGKYPDGNDYGRANKPMRAAEECNLAAMQEAGNDFLAALALQPHDRLTRLNCAIALSDAGEPARAREQLLLARQDAMGRERTVIDQFLAGKRKLGYGWMND